jgi:hypothetical protein
VSGIRRALLKVGGSEMARIDATKWFAVFAIMTLTALDHAQNAEEPLHEATPEAAFFETMSAGLGPLFTAMAAGITFMLLLAALTTAILRPRFRLPRSSGA